MHHLTSIHHHVLRVFESALLSVSAGLTKIRFETTSQFMRLKDKAFYYKVNEVDFVS